MTEIFYILSALSPLLCLVLLITFFHQPAYKAALASLILTFLVSNFVWQVESAWITAAVLRGVFVTLEILVVIIGALLLLYALKEARAFVSIQQSVEKISADKRIQLILIAWFFVAFIEGAAGFGTPAALAAPLLVVIGFPALAAATLALIGDSVAVTYGAVGLPILLGVTQGLDQNLIVFDLVSNISKTTALIHFAIGSFVPLLMSILLCGIFGKDWKSGFGVWRFALLAGFAFTAPYILIAWFLGPEFPSLFGAIVGGAIAIFALRFKFFQPKNIWQIPEKHLSLKQDINPEIKNSPTIFHSILPYLLVGGLLVATRLPFFGVKDFFASWQLGINRILATDINYSLAVFQSPGIIFIAITFFAMWYFKLSSIEVKNVFKNSFLKLLAPASALLFIITMVQLFVYSGVNQSGLVELPLYLANQAALAGAAWPLLAPLVGLFGAFVAGSSTVSNLLFSQFQYDTAVLLGMSPVLIIALQAVGSAVGNMIAVHNVVAVLATVGLMKAEGKVIKYNFFPAIGYALIAGIIGLLAVNLFA